MHKKKFAQNFEIEEQIWCELRNNYKEVMN